MLKWTSAEGSGDNEAVVVGILNRAPTPGQSFARIRKIVATFDDADNAALTSAMVTVESMAYDDGEDPDYPTQGYAGWNGGNALPLGFVPPSGFTFDVDIEVIGAVTVTMEAMPGATGHLLLGYE